MEVSEGTEQTPRGHTYSSHLPAEGKQRTDRWRCRKGPGRHREDTPTAHTYRRRVSRGRTAVGVFLAIRVWAL